MMLAETIVAIIAPLSVRTYSGHLWYKSEAELRMSFIGDTSTGLDNDIQVKTLDLKALWSVPFASDNCNQFTWPEADGEGLDRTKFPCISADWYSLPKPAPAPCCW